MSSAEVRVWVCIVYLKYFEVYVMAAGVCHLLWVARLVRVSLAYGGCAGE